METRWHDVKGVAGLLGLSLGTVYSLCERRVIDHIRVGQGRGAIRISQAALDAFIEQATVPMAGGCKRHETSNDDHR